MTVEYTVGAHRHTRTKFVECPYCGTRLDEPIDEGGPGTSFPTHWRNSCPVNNEGDDD